MGIMDMPNVPDAGLPARLSEGALNATYAQGVNVTDPRFGAKGDGITDDGPAIRAAVAAAGGKRIFFPAGTYYYKATGALSLPGGTLLEGFSSGSTKILFDTSSAGVYREFARNTGDDVTISGLTIERGSDFPTVLFPIQNFAAIKLRDFKVNGNRDIFPTNYCHVMQLGVQNGGTFTGLNVRDSTFTKCSYVLFQTNASTGIARELQFYRCTFDSNFATDLEFNAPASDNYNIIVKDSTFKNNQATSVGAGFGVGLAHVTGAKLINNTFDGYNNEAVHIEDYSTDVLVDGNSFKRCGLLFAAYIRIISGARYVKIVNNDFDATTNTNFIPVIQSVAGGTGLTPGGRTMIDPFRVDVIANQIQAGGCHGVYLSANTGGIVAKNTIQGAGSVTAGVFGGGNGGYGLELWDGYGIAVLGNTIRGFESALNRRTGTVSTGGKGLAVTGNTVQHCNYGLAVVNPGGGSIASNVMVECVHPTLVGQGQGTSKPVTISSNTAIDCVYPMEIGGRLVVVSAGAAAVGAGQSLAIKSLGLNLTTGQSMTFSGGGTLVLTSPALAGATTLTGTVSGAAIASGESVIINGLPHSTTDADNRVTIGANTDTVAGKFGTYDKRLNVYNFKPAQVFRLRTALAKAAAGVALGNIAFVGDSTVAGTNGGNTPATTAWPVLFRNMLPGLGYPSAGSGFVAAYRAASASDPRWTYGSGWGGANGNSNKVANSTTTNALTFASVETGTQTHVYYSNAGGPFTVSVDGGAPVTVTPTGASSMGVLTATGLADTTHTISVVRTSGTVEIFGVEIRKTTTGVRIYNAGIAGAKVASLANATWDSVAQTVAGGAASQFTADAIFLCCEINDMTGGGGSVVDPATYKTQMQTAITNLRVNGASLILIAANPVQTGDFTAYTKALYDLADTNDLPLIDLQDRWGSYTTANARGMMGDTVHPSPAGNADIARNVLNASGI
ncbi:right-handed parallel beta-helix repeat-containing protein [Paenarthrobacter sp. JL.01a]|uniref:right-handed parallel beta-helix repeat-containing protein n=1 Tax=Paenarthrobacter sp. JL.01a TaxID=2979324 RepID=UPI0021C90FC4|nr:right-handed parallel beta-helix repeat-containing protein [Paenarthrobacter sp. JL.01a]UXM90962.1 GDSL-type esterase/lipase family protein [Paenarthrobacter sp. JL.01a]